VAVTFAGETSGSRALRRVGQILLAILATLLLGVGIAWAASGTNPIASIFTRDLRVENSNVGIDSFEDLEPMTQETLEALPPGVAQRATFKAIHDTIMDNQMHGRPSFGYRKDPAVPFRPDPASISAIGQGETNLGTPVTLLVIDGEICYFTGEDGYGSGGCGDIEDVERGRFFGWGSERNSRLNHVYGLVGDDVATVELAGSDRPPIEVPGNVYELRNMRWEDVTLVGYDEDGNELFRHELPLSMKP